MESKTLHQGSELAPSRRCGSAAETDVLLGGFSGSETAGPGARDECYLLLEENNFTDLTFGEKENSEQGPTVRTKQARYASSFECARVTFQSPWLVLPEQDSSRKPVLVKIPFCGRGGCF